MLEKVLMIGLFTLIIHLSETLSYAVRLAGVRTGRLAVALSLTGMIVLVSRTSNLIQAPLTGGLIDKATQMAGAVNIENQFRFILLSASIGTVLAILLFPTSVRIAARLIAHLELAGSIPQMLKNSVSIERLQHVTYHLRIPRWRMLSRLRIGGIPKRLLLMNSLVTAIYTVGVLAALYASLLVPEYKATAAMSSGLINGFATVIFTILVDPQVAILTDRAIQKQANTEDMNKTFVLLMFSRLFGTLLAQLLFIPAAYWVKWTVPFFAS